VSVEEKKGTIMIIEREKIRTVIPIQKGERGT